MQNKFVFYQLSRYVCTRRVQFPLQNIHVVSFSDNDGGVGCFVSRSKDFAYKYYREPIMVFYCWPHSQVVYMPVWSRQDDLGPHKGALVQPPPFPILDTLC